MYRLYPRNSYTFIIYAKDAAGNASGSVSVSATLPADTTPPSTAPIVTVTDVGSTCVSLAWTAAQDDGPYLFDAVLVDGSPVVGAGTNLSATVNLLEPETTYTFNVLASDYGSNLSPLSDSVIVTTEPTTFSIQRPTPNQTASSLGRSMLNVGR